MIVSSGEKNICKQTSRLVLLSFIKELFRECRGNAVRIQEELNARHGILIPYQTLTWLLRKHEIGRQKHKKRAGEVEEGEEIKGRTLLNEIFFCGHQFANSFLLS